jgi:Protein of unknown function (DUF2933)
MKYDSSRPEPEPGAFWRSRYGVGLVVLGAIAAYFLITEHRAHVFAALPFVLLLACPLMHVFMHRGHGGHGSHGSGPPAGTPDKRNGEQP